MARDETPPFIRGNTINGGNTIDLNNLTDVNREGQEFRFEDTVYKTGSAVYCRCVRNAASFNLLPKRLVKFQSGYIGRRVDGYTSVTNQQGYPVDELLPSTGVRPGDLFYIVTRGPAAVLTGLAGDATNVIASGDILVAITAATSGATTAGRIATMSGATQQAATVPLGRVAVANDAATTGNTNASIVAMIIPWL